MASRFACIATSRRRRALAASLSSHAVRTRRATASMRRMTGSWQDMVDSRASHDVDDRRGDSRASVNDPAPAIISRR